jgi:hypothetical protein
MAKSKNKRIKEIFDNLLRMFETGDMPKAVARTIIRAKEGDAVDIPCLKWSFGNLLLTILAGTEDARGFRQWEKVGRKVKKGAKAFYILAPCTRKITETVEDPDTSQETTQETVIVTGFRPIPVFRYEDTEGEPIDRPDYTPPVLPPLYKVAEQFGQVKYLPYAKGGPLGQCNIGTGDMALFSHDVEVFFHELAHSVDRELHGLVPGQDPEQEIVAEFTAAVLCVMYGFEGYIPHSWEYIQGYVGKKPSRGIQAIMKVLGRVEAIVTRILEVEATLAKAQIA